MSSRPPASLVPLLHVPTYFGLSLVWMVAVGVFTAVWVIAANGPAAMTPDALEQTLGAGGMGALSILQIVGLAGAAIALTAVLPAASDTLYSTPESWTVGRVLQLLAFRRAPWPLIVAAGLGALTVWTFPSWVAEQLIPLLPDGASSTLQMLTDMVRSAPLGGKSVLLFAIVISAPLFEEVIFRGYLWATLEHAAPGWVVWLLTSLFFAMYHLDPVHTVSLLPTALFLGWLRWVSGSVWPSIVAHFVNNAIAATVTVLVTDSDSSSLMLAPAVLGGLFTMACCGVGWALARTPEPS